MIPIAQNPGVPGIDFRRAPLSEVAARDLPQADMVTSIIEHDVRPGSEAGYEAWLKTITPISQRFPGHRGIQAIGPAEGSSKYTLMLRFDTLEHAQDWFQSAARKELIANVQPYLKSGESIDIKTGLEFWFKPPRGRKQAPAYRQALVTLVVLYPLTMIVPWLLQQAAAFMPVLANPFVANLVIDAIIVALLTYVFMPYVTRLLARWIFS